MKFKLGIELDIEDRVKFIKYKDGYGYEISCSSVEKVLKIKDRLENEIKKMTENRSAEDVEGVN